MNKIFKTLLMTLPVAAFVFAANAHADQARLQKKYDDQVKDVVDEYNEAIYKINNSGWVVEQQQVLTTQAETNRDLALKQAKEAYDQLMTNLNERASLDNPINENDKNNQKIIYEVDEILLD